MIIKMESQVLNRGYPAFEHCLTPHR
jgi:hypothetical protein